MEKPGHLPGNDICSNIRITTVYDNNTERDGLAGDWGFSCFVETDSLRLLFDTGADGSILMDNMKKLNIAPDAIDIVFLSHHHNDHIGGLEDLLRSVRGMKVYYPESFPANIVNTIVKNGSVPISVNGFQEIIPGIYSLGVLGKTIHEQALAIRSRKGIVIITGCAHPGIVTIIEKAGKHFPGTPIYLALGGFHMHKMNKAEINTVIDSLKKTPLMFVAPCHCTGEPAVKRFRAEYKEHFIQNGVSKVITID